MLERMLIQLVQIKRAFIHFNLHELLAARFLLFFLDFFEGFLKHLVKWLLVIFDLPHLLFDCFKLLLLLLFLMLELFQSFFDSFASLSSSFRACLFFIDPATSISRPFFFSQSLSSLG